MSDVLQQHPNLDAIVRTFDLAADPVDMCLNQPGGGLDYGHLQFGKRYRALRSFAANRLGEVRKGEALHFLGFYICPDDQASRLYFERRNQMKLILEFAGDLPETPDHVPMIPSNQTRDYFAPVAFDFSRRTGRLRAARSVIHYHQERVLP